MTIPSCDKLAALAHVPQPVVDAICMNTEGIGGPGRIPERTQSERTQPERTQSQVDRNVQERDARQTKRAEQSDRIDTRATIQRGEASNRIADSEEAIALAERLKERFHADPQAKAVRQSPRAEVVSDLVG